MSAFKIVLILGICILGGTANLMAGSAKPDSLRGRTVNLPDNWLAKDKLLHFGAGMLVSAGSGYLLKNAYHSPANAAGGFGVAVSVSLGTIKELADSRQSNSHFCLRDLTADIAGAICGYFLVEAL